MNPYLDTYHDEKGNQRFSLMELTEEHINLLSEIFLTRVAEKHRIIQNLKGTEQLVDAAAIKTKTAAEIEVSSKILMALTGRVYKKANH